MVVLFRTPQWNVLPVKNKAIMLAVVSKKDTSAVAYTRDPRLKELLLVGIVVINALLLAIQTPLVRFLF